MSNATITIGRNVGDAPMSDDRWAEFHARTLGALGPGAEIYVDAEIPGEWRTVAEDARVIVAGVPDEWLPVLRDALAGLAVTFGQDAIGFSAGPGELLAR